MKTQSLKKAVILIAGIFIFSTTLLQSNGQTMATPGFVTIDTTTSKSMESFEAHVVADQNGEKFILEVSNPFSEKIRISISGPEGTGFIDHTKLCYYRKRINLTDAQDGDYVVTVTGNSKTFTRSIKLNTSTVLTRSLVIK